MHRTIKFTLAGFFLYLLGFGVAFAPFAFSQSPTETAQLMNGWGGWALVVGGVLGVIGLVAHISTVVLTIKQAITGQSYSAAALLWALLPLLLVPLLVYVNRGLLF
ncbi:MAG: hypothetical protein R3Y10_02815 [Ferrimonas sp.]